MIEARNNFFEVVDRLKKEKIIKSTLELTIQTTAPKISSLNSHDSEDWFMVSDILTNSEEEVLATFKVNNDEFKILKATLAKCPRCWKQKSKDEETVCQRCSKVVS